MQCRPGVFTLFSMYCGFWVNPTEIMSRSISTVLEAKWERLSWKDLNNWIAHHINPSGDECAVANIGKVASQLWEQDFSDTLADFLPWEGQLSWLSEKPLGDCLKEGQCLGFSLGHFHYTLKASAAATFISSPFPVKSGWRIKWIPRTDIMLTSLGHHWED